MSRLNQILISFLLSILILMGIFYLFKSINIGALTFNQKECELKKVERVNENLNSLNPDAFIRDLDISERFYVYIASNDLRIIEKGWVIAFRNNLAVKDLVSLPIKTEWADIKMGVEELINRNTFDVSKTEMQTLADLIVSLTCKRPDFFR